MQKTAEATRDLTGNKIADKIISVSKTKSNKKNMKQIKNKKSTHHQQKDSKLLMT